MTLVDNIGKSVGDIAENVAKKSGDLVETTKINLRIKDEEDKMKSTYLELGKILYQNYSNLAEGNQELMQLCFKLDEHKGNVESLKEALNNIKNSNICSKCGSGLAENIKFCGNCGNKVNVTQHNNHENEIVINNCPNCNEEVSNDYIYCINCGAKIK